MSKSIMLMPVLASASILFFPITIANAASVCKGKEEQACKSLEVYKGIPACTWMPGRGRADGGVTKAHCRGSNKKLPEGVTKIESANAEPSKTN